MLLAGWEVRIGKNCYRGLENVKPEVTVSTLRRPITFLSFSSCRKLAYQFFTSGFAIESAYAPSTVQTIIRKKFNEQTSE